MATRPTKSTAKTPAKRKPGRAAPPKKPNIDPEQLLDDYRDGRIFFIGDSAHIVPIFGVRGLNNGMADGQNIGWKLAWVLNGYASEALLDSYTPERRGATLDVFANATKSTRFMTPPTHGWQVMRDAALSLALTRPSAGRLANPRQMTPYTYADSPATTADGTGFSAGPVPGAMITCSRVTRTMGASQRPVRLSHRWSSMQPARLQSGTHMPGPPRTGSQTQPTRHSMGWLGVQRSKQKTSRPMG